MAEMDAPVENPMLNVESPAVRAHLEIVQDNIRRMADNSSSCKNWWVMTAMGGGLIAYLAGIPASILMGLMTALPLMLLNQYQGGMCISVVLKTISRIPRHLTSPLTPTGGAAGGAV